MICRNVPFFWHLTKQANLPEIIEKSSVSVLLGLNPVPSALP
jgi:hypothetical protein